MRESRLNDPAWRLFFAKATSRGPFRFHSRDYWEAPLGEPPERAFSRLVEAGLVRAAPDEALIELKHTVDSLKRLLRERGLKVGGRKAELVARMKEADPVWWGEECRPASPGLDGRPFERTEEGQRLADEIYAEIGADRARIELELLDLVAAGDLLAAHRAWARWCLQQVFRAESGTALNDLLPLAEFLASELQPGDARRLLVGAIMGNYTGASSEAMRALRAWWYRRDLLSYRACKNIKGLQIVAPDGAVCAQAAKYAANYRLRDAPVYPFGPCDLEGFGGCRCTWLAIFEDEARGLVWRWPKERHPCAGPYMERAPEPLTLERLRATGAVLGADEASIQEAARNAGLRPKHSAPAPGLIASLVRAVKRLFT